MSNVHILSFQVDHSLSDKYLLPRTNFVLSYPNDGEGSTNSCQLFQSTWNHGEVSKLCQVVILKQILSKLFDNLSPLKGVFQAPIMIDS